MFNQCVHIVTIGAKDVSKLRSFYLGLDWCETEMSSDEYCVFKTGGVMFAIYPLAELLKETCLPINNGSKGFAMTICVESREMVDKTIDGLKSKGVKIVSEPIDMFWGGRSAYFHDPEDNPWEIAWIPSATFGAKGELISY